MLVELPSCLGTPSNLSVVVHPLTHKAAATLPDEGLLVTRFPLRIGRATEPWVVVQILRSGS